MGCGETLTSCLDGAPPVIAPVESVGNTTCDMKTFHDWSLWLVGSTWRLEPYQTASARPAPRALIHANTLFASPVVATPSLSCTGAAHLVHPVAALAALTTTCRRAGLRLASAHTTWR